MFKNLLWIPRYTDPSNSGLTNLTPELWAQEALLVLEENMMMPFLVHTNFNSQFAEYGDTLNIPKPGTFEAKRKVDDDEVTVQAASADKIQVTLDQHIHVSFMIKDGEETKSFVNLRETFLVPAIRAMAAYIDKMLTYQCYRFMLASGSTAYQAVGKIGTALTRKTVIQAREHMNTSLVPEIGRNFILTPNSEGDLLDIDNFIKVNERGSSTTLQKGTIGSILGFNFYMCQHQPSLTSVNCTTKANAVKLAAGYAAGTTTMVIDGAGVPVAGEWCVIAGDMMPHMFVTVTPGSSEYTVVITPPLANAVADDAVITTYDSNNVDQALTTVAAGADGSNDGYRLGWNKLVHLESVTTVAKVGQMLTTGITAATMNRYGVMSSSAIDSADNDVLLDRSLAAAVANDGLTGIGPAGDYNFAFHRNAFTFVTRPLKPPAPGTGAASAVAAANGVGLRVTITYDGRKQGHLITVDFLAGIGMLDQTLGMVILR